MLDIARPDTNELIVVLLKEYPSEAFVLAPPTPTPGSISGPTPGTPGTPGAPGAVPAVETDAGGPDMADAGGAVRLWVDTHVHLHDGQDAEAFLDGAAQHFAAAGAEWGVLCLTETEGVHGFQRLADAGVVGRWRIEHIGPFGLVAKRDDAAVIGLIAGRQIRCNDGLEVAAVGRTVEIEDGLAFEAAIDAVRAAGALVMLCYGVGKWSGARGAKVRAVLEDGPSDVAFGDNSGRLGWGEQSILKRARALGRTVLVGSDPLQLSMAKQRAGCWGVVAEVPGGAALDETWSDRVVDTLRQLGPTPTTFGERVGCVTAIAQQIGVRLP